MGSDAVALLLQTDRTFAKQLHFAFEPRVFPVQPQSREDHEDTQEEHHGDGRQVAVVTGDPFAHQDVAREKEPEGIGLAPPFQTPVPLLPLAFGLLLFALGAELLFGVAPLHAQHLAPDFAPQLLLLSVRVALLCRQRIEFVVVVHRWNYFFTAARSLAERERGLRSSSCCDGVTALRVSRSKGVWGCP